MKLNIYFMKFCILVGWRVKLWVLIIVIKKIIIVVIVIIIIDDKLNVKFRNLINLLCFISNLFFFFVFIF